MGLIRSHKSFLKRDVLAGSRKKVEDSEHEKDLMGPYWLQDGGEHAYGKECRQLYESEPGNRDLSLIAARN